MSILATNSFCVWVTFSLQLLKIIGPLFLCFEVALQVLVFNNNHQGPVKHNEVELEFLKDRNLFSPFNDNQVVVV